MFGSGPDGGREATFDGAVRYPDPSPEGLWDGYGVVQAKFKETSAGTAEDTVWFKARVAAELNDWADPLKNRVKRGRLPEYLIFATNVALSADPGRGGIDSVDTLIESYRGRLPLKGWRVWHHRQICTFLDTYPSVRRTYAAFTTPGDVLAALQERILGAAEDLTLILTAHAAKELIAQQWVRLGESGDADNRKIALGRVAVDLPASTPGVRVNSRAMVDIKVDGIVDDIIGRGDQVRRPSQVGGFHRNVVVVGGPGQGKSTIGQLLCQVYRTALLSGRPAQLLGAEAAQLRDQLKVDISDLGIRWPACRPWPIQISLRRFGDAIAGGEDTSLLRFVARTMSARTEITPSQLRTWLGDWPWLLVLDGLDEVAAPSVRETLFARISDFLVDAATVDADLLVVATTRPQGYAHELGPEHYDHLELLPLTVDEARPTRDGWPMCSTTTTRICVAGCWSGSASPLTSR